MTRPVLSADQIDHYWRHGYVVVRGLVPVPVTRRVIAAAERKATQETFRQDAKHWLSIILDFTELDAEPEIHEALVTPRVIDAVEQLFVGPARCFYAMLATVNPHGGRGLAWHQDNQYTTVLGHALNTFIACNEITPERCQLWVSPGSHLWGVQPDIGDGRGHKQAVDPGNGICLPTLAPGDACIFHRNTLHRSQTNTTEQVRHAYAAQYCEAQARANGPYDFQVIHNPLARDLAAHWAALPGPKFQEAGQ